MKITNTEDLRAELDKFSPEQERDRKEAEVNKEIADLTETLSDIKDTIYDTILLTLFYRHHARCSQLGKQFFVCYLVEI